MNSFRTKGKARHAAAKIRTIAIKDQNKDNKIQLKNSFRIKFLLYLMMILSAIKELIGSRFFIPFPFLDHHYAF